MVPWQKDKKPHLAKALLEKQSWGEWRDVGVKTQNFSWVRRISSRVSTC